MVVANPSRMRREHWIAFLIEGIILVILGAAAIFNPVVSAGMIPPAILKPRWSPIE